MSHYIIPDPWVVESLFPDIDGYKIRPKSGGLLVAVVKNQDSRVAGQAKQNARVIALAPDLLDFVMSLENDDGSIPKFMWDWRNRLVSQAQGCDE